MSEFQFQANPASQHTLSLRSFELQSPRMDLHFLNHLDSKLVSPSGIFPPTQSSSLKNVSNVVKYQNSFIDLQRERKPQKDMLTLLREMPRSFLQQDNCSRNFPGEEVNQLNSSHHGKQARLKESKVIYQKVNQNLYIPNFDKVNKRFMPKSNEMTFRSKNSQISHYQQQF